LCYGRNGNSACCRSGARYGIGVNQGGTTRYQHLADGALATADSAGQAQSQRSHS